MNSIGHNKWGKLSINVPTMFFQLSSNPQRRILNKNNAKVHQYTFSCSNWHIYIPVFQSFEIGTFEFESLVWRSFDDHFMCDSQVWASHFRNTYCHIYQRDKATVHVAHISNVRPLIQIRIWEILTGKTSIFYKSKHKLVMGNQGIIFWRKNQLPSMGLATPDLPAPLQTSPKA